MTENNVLKAGSRLGEMLKGKGATVYLGIIPDIDPEVKTGVDDFIIDRGFGSFKQWLGTVKPFEHAELFYMDLLLSEIPVNTPKEEIPFKIKSLIKELVRLDQGIGEQYINSKIKEYFSMTRKEVNSLMKLFKDARKKSKGSRGEDSIRYTMDEEGYFCRIKHEEGFPVSQRLLNVEVRIEKEVIEDNGVDRSSVYILSGKRQGETLHLIEEPVSSFSSMNWLSKWGSRAIIEPGYTVKDYIRHGIMVTSCPVTELLYSHTGWRELSDNYVYLTAGGSIGDENIRIKLPKELERYSLPFKPENEREAIGLSLSFLDIGKKSITLPLLGAVYLAPLTSLLNPMPNFIMYFYGPTGTFKTTVATLSLCHFGMFEPDMLSSFNDTANAIERRAFTLKDVPMLLDDYHPSSSSFEAHEKERIAQRIVRAFSNRTGRARLNPDATEKGRYEPRGLLIITAEELVSVQSTLARLSLIEIHEGDIAKGSLSILQAQSALLPHAMSSYIHWVRDNIVYIKDQFKRQFPELRLMANQTARLHHLKLCEQVSFLQFSVNLLTEWAIQKGALSEEDASNLRDESWEIFLSNAENLNYRLRDEDPVLRFREIIMTLLAQSKVRLEDTDTGNYYPINALYADSVGYYDENYVYFLPTALWNSILRFCRSEGTNFPCTKNTLFRHLRDQKWIETGSGENTKTCRIHGESIRVLKMYRKNILPEVLDHIMRDSVFLKDL